MTATSLDPAYFRKNQFSREYKDSTGTFDVTDNLRETVMSLWPEECSQGTHESESIIPPTPGQEMPHDLFSNTVSGRKSGDTLLVTSSTSNTSQTTTNQDITNSIFNCLCLDDGVDVETNPVNQPSSLENRQCAEIEE